MVVLVERMGMGAPHGIVKPQAVVPQKDIEKAARRKAQFDANPRRHTFVPPED